MDSFFFRILNNFLVLVTLFKWLLIKFLFYILFLFLFVKLQAKVQAYVVFNFIVIADI